MLIVGVDTGGTFTDLIFREGDAWRVHKVLSTPLHPADALLDGLRDEPETMKADIREIAL